MKAKSFLQFSQAYKPARICGVAKLSKPPRARRVGLQGPYLAAKEEADGTLSFKLNSQIRLG